jgi:hypothetical protein
MLNNTLQSIIIFAQASENNNFLAKIITFSTALMIRAHFAQNFARKELPLKTSQPL